MAEYAEPVQGLLDELSRVLGHQVQVEAAGTASGVLNHDQGDLTVNADGQVTVTITDTTNIDYTLSHELVHFMMNMKGYLMMEMPLHGDDQEYDAMRISTAKLLELAAQHVMVVAWQRENGLLDDGVDQSVIAGFEQQLDDEDPDHPDDMIAFRTLLLLDGLVYVHQMPKPDNTLRAWRNRYPAAMAAAEDLFALISEHEPDTPRRLRGVEVKLLAHFEQFLIDQGYAQLSLPDFVVVPPVLSQRQLRLELTQLYTLNETSLNVDGDDLTGYVAQGNTDEQTAFVLTLPSDAASADALQALYQRPVKDVLDEFELTYSER